jgi:hypothetical protein
VPRHPRPVQEALSSPRAKCDESCRVQQRDSIYLHIVHVRLYSLCSVSCPLHAPCPLPYTTAIEELLSLRPLPPRLRCSPASSPSPANARTPTRIVSQISSHANC